MAQKNDIELGLEQLRIDLRGKFQQIADHCNVSKQTVSNTLNGRHQNQCVIDYAIDLRNTLKKKRTQALKKLLYKS